MLRLVCLPVSTIITDLQWNQVRPGAKHVDAWLGLQPASQKVTWSRSSWTNASIRTHWIQSRLWEGQEKEEVEHLVNSDHIPDTELSVYALLLNIHSSKCFWAHLGPKITRQSAPESRMEEWRGSCCRCGHFSFLISAPHWTLPVTGTSSLSLIHP